MHSSVSLVVDNSCRTMCQIICNEGIRMYLLGKATAYRCHDTHAFLPWLAHFHSVICHIGYWLHSSPIFYCSHLLPFNFSPGAPLGNSIRITGCVERRELLALLSQEIFYPLLWFEWPRSTRPSRDSSVYCHTVVFLFVILLSTLLIVCAFGFLYHIPGLDSIGVGLFLFFWFS